MRDSVFSKKFFYIRALFLLGFCYFCGLFIPDSYAGNAYSEFYLLNSRLDALNGCSDGVVPFGTLDSEYSDRATEFKFEDDFVLNCDIEVYDNFDLDLSGHTMSVLNGHKITTKRGILRIYNGSFNDVRIETNAGTDLVFGSGSYNNLEVHAGTSYEEALLLNDKNEVYLQGGYYDNSTFYISQNAFLDIDGASFVSDSSNEETASVVLRLDEREDAGQNIDAALNIEAAYFKNTSTDCDEASIKIEAPDMAHNNAHIEAVIEYANFEGQNAIVTNMGSSRTGDELIVLDGESALDGSYIISYGNSSDPILSISNGEYMTKSSFYGDLGLCSEAESLRAELIEAGIFSDSNGLVPSEGHTLLPIRDRDFDGDGNSDVEVRTGIDTTSEELNLKEGERKELSLLNLDGESILADDVEWFGNNEYASGDGLMILAQKAGKTELILKYGTQEKKYIVTVIEDPDNPSDNPSDSSSESGRKDDEATAPLTEDTVLKNKWIFAATGFMFVLSTIIMRECFVRKRIEK